MADDIPCHEGKECPAVREVQLKMQLEAGRIIQKEIKEVYQPFLKGIARLTDSMQKLRETSIVTNERLVVGTEKFIKHTKQLEEQEEKIDDMQRWQDVHDGQSTEAEKNAEKKGRVAGQIWGGSLGGASLLSQIFRMIWE